MGSVMRAKFGLKLSRNATPDERRAYDRERRAMVRSDPALMARQRKHEARYRKNNKEALKRRQAQWHREHPTEWEKIKRASYERHREELNAKQRAQNRTPERKAFMRSYAPKYRAAHQEAFRTYAENRRARQLGASGSHTDDEWLAVLARNDGLCVYCRVAKGTHRDHDIALARGGSNDINNIVPACGPCNSAKGTLTGEEFRKRLAGFGASTDFRWRAQLEEARCSRRG